MLLKVPICLAVLICQVAAVPVQNPRGTGIISPHTLLRLSNRHRHESQIALAADQQNPASMVNEATSGPLAVKLRPEQLVDGVAVLEDSSEVLSMLKRRLSVLTFR